MLTDLAIIAAGLAGLVWSADQFVDGAAAIARRLGMAPLLIGMTIVSVGTSAPEILVSLMSALSDSGELAVGNALGSNIANIGMVLGATLLISPITVGRTTCRTDLPLLTITVLACFALLADQVLSLFDALVLLAGLALFIGRMVRHAEHPDINDETPEIPDMSLMRAWVAFLVGLLALIGSSRALVWASVNVAETLGISELIIGLTIVAIGTSLPELAASAVSAMRGHADIAIGAVVGSNMFNLLVVLAIPGLFGELPLERDAVWRDLPMVLITTLALVLATRAGWQADTHRARLGRTSGAVFLSLYVVYYLWLFTSPEISMG
jgi:cation:H+ antiporter